MLLFTFALRMFLLQKGGFLFHDIVVFDRANFRQQIRNKSASFTRPLLRFDTNAVKGVKSFLEKLIMKKAAQMGGSRKEQCVTA